jgi:hypothetical protein
MGGLVVAAACLCGTAAGEEIKEILYLPFDGDTKAVIARGAAEPYQARVDAWEEGVVGKAARSEKRYNGIRYDGRGDIDLNRGTLALFYKPLRDPGVGAWDPFFGVSSDLEGYWAGVLQFINKQDLNKQTMTAVHFFDIGRYSPMIAITPIYGRWKKDQWHHIAIVWDRFEGIKVYEDGRLATGNWGKFRWDWSASPRTLVFGEFFYSTTPFSVDEVHVYASCLTDTQVAQLAQGQKPTGEPIAIAPEAQRRPYELARMGWTEEDLAQLPRATGGGALRYTFARIEKCVDANRQVAQPFEGFRDSCWPLQKYGASLKGRALQIHFQPEQRFDRARIFTQRPYVGRLMEVLPGVGARKLADVASPRPLWRTQFAQMRTDRVMQLERETGQVGQVDFFRVDPLAAAPKTEMTFSTAPADRLPPTLAGRAALGETEVRFDNPVRGLRAPAPAWTLASPAFGGFQFLSETLEEATPIDSVVVTLVAEKLAGPTPVRILIKEPVMPQRDWLDAEAVLEPKGAGPQRFTFHLKGRPVLSYPKTKIEGKRLKADEPGREIAVLVTAAEPVTWRMGEGGTTVGLVAAAKEAILAACVADQTEFARESYAETNEGHIWDNVGPHGWGRLYYPQLWLMQFAPEARATMEIASRVNWRAEPLPFVEPKNETGAPDWAFWQMQSMRANRRILHWIIDNRQTENGEYGGVWGDDTDMSEYWTSAALGCDDDGKIRAAMRKFMAGLYRECLVEGVSRTIRDNLHSYEEGMGTICHQLLFDYGNPTAVERVMRASSHYDPKWMKKNEDGSYSFKSNYLGYEGVYEEGDFGKDSGVNFLMLYPAAYLTWYNRHPSVTPFIAKWQRAPETRGLVYDAWLRLTEADPAKRASVYAEKLAKADGARDPEAVNSMLLETGMKPEWRDRFLKQAQGNPFGFFSGKLPDYAGYSGRMTEYFWLAWQASGDLKWLVQSDKQACTFINNQEWLYTVAQPSTDRIPLPECSMLRSRIGALATTRGASGCFWPRHALSYTAGSEQVAILVTENTETSLAARFYCFAEKPNLLAARLWRLQPGTYKAVLSSDRDNDGQAEDVLREWTLEVDRGAPLEVTLPPRAGSLLRIEAVKTRPQEYDLPDAAIGPEDAMLEYGDHLHVTVHNIGTKPVENLEVRVRDGHTGALIGTRTIKRIEAPLDLMPKTVLLELQNANAITRGSIIIELDPDRKHPDLNRYNNTLVYKY